MTPTRIEQDTTMALYEPASWRISSASLAEIEGETQALHGPCAITIEKGRTHTVRAITNAVWFCIHPTDETDVDRIDEVTIGEYR